MASKDLTGKEFGKWKVLERSSVSGHAASWKCLCRGACGGNVRVVRGYYLLKALSTQCNDCARGYTNLVGRCFGKWAVIAKLDRSEVSDNRIWLCHCGCEHGTERRMSTATLVGCLSLSCRKCSIVTWTRKRPYEALFNRLRYNALREGKRFDLTYDEFLVFTEAQRCYYCNAAIQFVEYGHWSKGGQAHNLDRKNNALGYSKDNLVACCKRCNHAKGNRFTYEQWWGMTEYFRKSAA